MEHMCKGGQLVAKVRESRMRRPWCTVEQSRHSSSVTTPFTQSGVEPEVMA